MGKQRIDAWLWFRVLSHILGLAVLQGDLVKAPDFDRSILLAVVGDAEAERQVVAGVENCERGESDRENAPQLSQLQIPFFDDRQVVRRVTGNEIGQRAHGERVIAGDPLSQPGIFGQIAEEGDGGETACPEFR